MYSESTPWTSWGRGGEHWEFTIMIKINIILNNNITMNQGKFIDEKIIEHRITFFLYFSFSIIMDNRHKTDCCWMWFRMKNEFQTFRTFPWKFNLKIQPTHSLTCSVLHGTSQCLHIIWSYLWIADNNYHLIVSRIENLLMLNIKRNKFNRSLFQFWFTLWTQLIFKLKMD